MNQKRILSFLMAALVLGILLVTGCQGTADTRLLGSMLGRSEKGDLAVRIEGNFAGRSTTATAADVNSLTVDLKASNGATQSVTLNRSQLVSSPIATFSALVAGTAQLTMLAYDYSAHVIGSTWGSTSIVAGQTASVTLQLNLNPSYVYGTPAPTPVPATLKVNASLVDGRTITGPASGDVVVNVTPTNSGALSFSPSRLSLKAGASINFYNYDRVNSITIVRTDSGGSKTYYSASRANDPNYGAGLVPFGMISSRENTVGSFTFTIQNRTSNTLTVDVWP